MAENAILEELRNQGGGLAFLSRAWLVRLVRPEPPGRAPVGFPRDHRSLDQYLRKLETFEEIVRIRAHDGGAFYGLRETWDSVVPEAQISVRMMPTRGKGSPTTISFLVPGPAGLKPEARSKGWIPVIASARSTEVVAYRSANILGLANPCTGRPDGVANLEISPDKRWVAFGLSTVRPRGGKVAYEWYDESGQLGSSGKLRNVLPEANPSP